MEIMNEGKNDGKKNDKGKASNKSGWSNYFDKSNKKERDPDAMDIDRLSPEKRTFLMKKGACFICEEPGHLAKDHDEHKKKEKKKTSTRRTEAESSKTPSKPSAKKRDINKIHALLQALTAEETKELLALQPSGQGTKEKEKEKEEEKEDDDSDSDSGF